MKTKNIPLLLIPAIALAACMSNETAKVGTDHEELASAYAEPAIEFSKVRVTCKVVTADGSEVQTFAPLTLKRGVPLNRSYTTGEQVSPTQFDFPEIGKGDFEGSFPVTPANPTAFETERFGWSMKLEANARQSFIMLSGSLTESRQGEKIRAGGAPFEPITTKATDALGREVEVVLTDNRAERPSKVTEEYPILIAAQPGKTARVYLDESKLSYVEFTCKIID